MGDLARKIADAILHCESDGTDFNVTVSLVPGQHVIVRADAACGTIQRSVRIDAPTLKEALLPSAIVSAAICHCVDDVAGMVGR